MPSREAQIRGHFGKCVLTPEHTWRLLQELMDTLPDCLYRTRLYLCRVATEGRHHAGAHLADLDRTSYRNPSPSGAGLHQLSAVFDGRDHDTFPRRSRPVFRTAQISILEDVESPQQGRGLYAGEPLQETSQARFPSPAKAERAAL